MRCQPAGLVDGAKLLWKDINAIYHFRQLHRARHKTIGSDDGRRQHKSSSDGQFGFEPVGLWWPGPIHEEVAKP